MPRLWWEPVPPANLPCPSSQALDGHQQNFREAFQEAHTAADNLQKVLPTYETRKALETDKLLANHANGYGQMLPIKGLSDAPANQLRPPPPWLHSLHMPYQLHQLHLPCKPRRLPPLPRQKRLMRLLSLQEVPKLQKGNGRVPLVGRRSKSSRNHPLLALVENGSQALYRMMRVSCKPHASLLMWCVTLGIPPALTWLIKPRRPRYC